MSSTRWIHLGCEGQRSDEQREAFAHQRLFRGRLARPGIRILCDPRSGRLSGRMGERQPLLSALLLLFCTTAFFVRA